MRTLVWFRGKDLRTKDHVPLLHAARAGQVIPLFVLDPFFFAPDRAAEMPHRVQFLVESLAELASRLTELGSRLLVVAGKSVEVVPRLARDWRVDQVVAHRWTEPFGRKRDALVQEALDVPLVLHEGETLAAPGTLRSGGGTPYAVFSAFERAFHRNVEVGEPLAAPQVLPPIPDDVQAETVPIPTVEALGIRRNPNLLPGGERAALLRLHAFVTGVASTYVDDRDRMDRAGTSRLSQDLKFGTLSARAVFRTIEASLRQHPRSLGKYLNELIWREFTHSTLWDRPELLRKPFRKKFEGFPWLNDAVAYSAWERGETGYPIVDASARQLLSEGFVHNRARMISASFLTKHLLIDYRRGEAHYMKWLTDGDWAQNNAGWQWSAGCGSDAAPYFRVFSPEKQGERFDPMGDYVRRWVPELGALPARYIHCPADAPERVLVEAGVRPGETYPLPIVDAAFGRRRFLATAEEHFSKAPVAPL